MGVKKNPKSWKKCCGTKSEGKKKIIIKVEKKKWGKKAAVKKSGGIKNPKSWKKCGGTKSGGKKNHHKSWKKSGGKNKKWFEKKNRGKKNWM